MLRKKLLSAPGKINFKKTRDFKLKKYFKFFPAIIFLIILGLFLPAGSARAFDLVGMIMDHTIYPVIYVVLVLILQIAWVLAWIGAYILNATLNPAIMNNVFASPAIYQGWALIRDICNLLFALIMLLVAFGTIAQSNKYNIKNSLAKLILAIFLINFSNVIAGAIIDFGNILMYGILGWMCASPATCFQDYMSGLMQVVNDFSNEYRLRVNMIWEGIKSQQVIGAGIAIVYVFIYAFILLALAAFLIVRTAGLALLMILAPFAYFGDVMPGMEKIAGKWWSNIWSYSLFGPIFALMLYMAGELAKMKMAIPPITDLNLGWYSATITMIVSNSLPLVFLLAIIPITKELGLGMTNTILQNTTGLGEKIGKGALNYAGGATDRWLARGAQDQRQGVRGALNRARSYLSPTTIKRAWESKTAEQKHDYDMAAGQVKDRMGWKRKGVESERDNIAENEAHRQFGEMNIKNTDEMIAKLTRAIEDKDGFLAAEILRALAVNGDINDALDRLSENKDHTAADYNQFMNDSIKPLLGDEKAGKLSEEIGKSEEKNGTYVYGGHNEYDKENDRYKMLDMREKDRDGKIKKDASGKDIMNNNVVAKQVDFMLGRWDSKNEQTRMSNVSKTSFVDKNGNYTVQGAALLSQMGAPETVEKANRLKPKAAKAIYEGKQKPNSEAVFKNEIFTNGKISKDLKLKDLQKMAGANNKAEADKIYKKIEENLKGKAKKKYKGGGYGAGQAENQEPQEAREAREARAREEAEEEELGGGGGGSPINPDAVKKKDEEIQTNRKELESYFEKQNRLETGFAKNKHGETIEEIEKIADTQGFKGIIIDTSDKGNISVGGASIGTLTKEGGKKDVVYYHNSDKNKLRVGSDTLKNIEDLFKVDKKFAKEAMTDIVKHEKEHTQCPAFEALQKEEAEIEKMVKEKNNNGYSLEEIRKERDNIHKKYYKGEKGRGYEQQTELQRAVRNAGSIKDLIEEEARLHVGVKIAHEGVDNLRKIKFSPENTELDDSHFGFIKPEYHEKIINRMEEMRQDLVNKYEEKMKKDAEKGRGGGGGGTGGDAGAGDNQSSGGSFASPDAVKNKYEEEMDIKRKELESQSERWDMEEIELAKKKYGETIKEIEKIAGSQGFKGTIVDWRNEKHIGVGGSQISKVTKDGKTNTVYYSSDKNKLRVGSETLKNIEDLFKSDDKFARETITDIVEHEKEHLRGPALKSSQKEEAEIGKMVKEKNNRGDSIEEIAKEMTNIHEKYYESKNQHRGYEQQTEIQRVTRKTDNIKDLIEKEARMHIGLDGAYKGMDYLKKRRYSSENTDLGDHSHFGFIKPEYHEKIINRMEEMRQDLVNKYEEKFKTETKQKSA